MHASPLGGEACFLKRQLTHCIKRLEEASFGALPRQGQACFSVSERRAEKRQTWHHLSSGSGIFRKRRRTEREKRQEGRQDGSGHPCQALLGRGSGGSSSACSLHLFTSVWLHSHLGHLSEDKSLPFAKPPLSLLFSAFSSLKHLMLVWAGG